MGVSTFFGWRKDCTATIAATGGTCKFPFPWKVPALKEMPDASH